MKKPTDVSAVAAAVRLIVKEPAPGTTFFMVAVASFVLITGKIIDDVVQSELFTSLDVSPAAMFIVPDGLLIVCAPVVPDAVFVAKNAIRPSFLMPKISVPPESSNIAVFAADDVPVPLTVKRPDDVVSVPIVREPKRWVRDVGLSAVDGLPIYVVLDPPPVH